MNRRMAKRPKPKRRKRLGFEWLECRQLLTGNDTFATAISTTPALGVPSTLFGTISDPNAVDIYSVELHVGEHFSANTVIPVGSTLSSHVVIYGPSKTN